MPGVLCRTGDKERPLQPITEQDEEVQDPHVAVEIQVGDAAMPVLTSPEEAPGHAEQLGIKDSNLD